MHNHRTTLSPWSRHTHGQDDHLENYTYSYKRHFHSVSHDRDYFSSLNYILNHAQERSQFSSISLFYSTEHQYLDISHEYASVFSTCSIHRFSLQLDHNRYPDIHLDYYPPYNPCHVHPYISHYTPGVTSSNISSKGSTTTSAITPTPSTTGTPRITTAINSSSVSTAMPNSTRTTITPTARATTGSLTTITDLTSTITASSTVATPTYIIPSLPTVQNTRHIIQCHHNLYHNACYGNHAHKYAQHSTSYLCYRHSGCICRLLSRVYQQYRDHTDREYHLICNRHSLSTSTNAITTSFGTIISSSISATITSSSLSSTSVTSMLTTTTTSLSTPSPLSRMENTGSSATAFTTPFSSETIRTSPVTSSLKTFATETTTTCFISSTTPCPESVSVTIAPASPTTSCMEMGPSSEVTSVATIPMSVFTSTTEMATSPGSTSMTTVFPMRTDASAVRETHPTNSITDAPSSSSVSTGTVPSYTVLTSAPRPTSGNWMNTNSITIPHMPGFTSLPLTTKPSNSFPTAMVTSIKSTHSTPTTTKTPETPAITPQSTTTLKSPRTTSTTTQMTTQSRLTTTPGTCDNGGTWMQGLCHCPLGFSGDHCELQEIRCQNGGKWDGLTCHCLRTFYGSRCEFVVGQVDLDTVDAEVGMEVSVDQAFSPDLNDCTSTAYKDFSDTFRDQMQKIYQNVQGFKDVEILSLRSGSIVVDYLVLLELPFSPHLESEYEKMKSVLKEELQNVSHNGDNCQNNQTLCFKPDSIKVNNNTRKELTLEAICRRATAKGYEDFYFPLVEENRLRCVTKCTLGVDGAIDCHQGQCLVERSGPACRCFSTDTHWFSGPRCQVAVAWRALIRGLAGVWALLLLGLLASLSLFVARSRSQRGGQGGGRSWDDDRKWFEIWDEDTVGTFSNLGLEDDQTVKEEHFQVALETVDTNVRVHIQRPEVGLILAVSPAPPPLPCPRHHIHFNGIQCHHSQFNVIKFYSLILYYKFF
nr:mucin-3A [Mirounga angustirostris]